jgi:hypothetical protein
MTLHHKRKGTLMLFRKPDQVREPLFAIVPVQNPWRWRSRWKHTERAIKHFVDSGAVVYLVEAAFNRREFAFRDSGLHDTLAECDLNGPDGPYRHQFIGLRSKDELWLKEGLINNGVRRLTEDHPDWMQVCWLDSDVHFARPNWVGECIHKLQHYKFLQMFSHARDLSPDYELLPEDYPHADGRGYIDAFYAGTLDAQPKDPGYYGTGYLSYPGRVWPGLAWACTRQAWDEVGGLLDVAIWGGGDWHMAHALVEKTEGMMRKDLHDNYKKIVMQWYWRCHTHIRRNVGVMSGSIFHHWHGKKAQRGYNTKHALLAKLGFDPLRHLKRDAYGLWQLHDDRSNAYVGLRDMLRRIALERNEDSIDV